MATKNWTKEQCLQLIDLYKDLPNLWNPKHIDYKKKHKRHNSFIFISKKMKMPKVEIERKIKNLISHFWREYKKVNSKKSKAGEEDTYTSIWFGYQSFNFLKDKHKCFPSMDMVNVKVWKILLYYILIKYLYL